MTCVELGQGRTVSADSWYEQKTCRFRPDLTVKKRTRCGVSSSDLSRTYGCPFVVLRLYSKVPSVPAARVWFSKDTECHKQFANPSEIRSVTTNPQCALEQSPSGTVPSIAQLIRALRDVSKGRMKAGRTRFNPVHVHVQGQRSSLSESSELSQSDETEVWILSNRQQEGISWNFI